MERRQFVTAGALTAVSASRAAGANERVIVALIGCGGRGRQVMRGLLEEPGTELAAACDVYLPNAERASNDLAGGRAKTLQDFRRLLEIKDVLCKCRLDVWSPARYTKPKGISRRCNWNRSF